MRLQERIHFEGFLWKHSWDNNFFWIVETKGIMENASKRGQNKKKYSLIDLMTIKNNKKCILSQGEEGQKEK